MAPLSTRLNSFAQLVGCGCQKAKASPAGTDACPPHKDKRLSFWRGCKTQKTQHHGCNRVLMPSEDAKIAKRWEEAAQGHSALELPNEVLKRLIHDGMPMKYRLDFWKGLSLRTNQQHMRYSVDPGDVESLQHLAPDDAVIRIAQDLPRTQPGQLNGGQLHSLQRVLLAYAAWNPTVGYCQGLNFVAAVFINLGFSESEAVMGMRYLLEEVCPDCHNASLSGYLRDAMVLDSLVQQFLPTLHAKLERVNVPVNLLAIDHFISLTSRTWPLEATVRLWDIIFLEGPSALFAAVLALLELFIPIAGDNMDDGPASSSSNDDMTPFDILESFKLESERGIASRMDEVFVRIHSYVKLIPGSLIEELRTKAKNK